jgi:hypothetical protein
MIRDLTKSMTSFSWAMSLFGVQQMTNLLMPQSPSQPTHRTTAAFNSVTQAAEEQLGQTLKEVYKAGDQLQKGATDLMMNFFTLEAFNPSQMMRTVSDAMKQSAGAFGRKAPQAPPEPHQETDWGSV